MSLIDDAKDLRRPRTLVRAARFAMLELRREPHLRRLLRVDSLPAPMTVVARLMQKEREIDSLRLEGDASYSVIRHIDILAALMNELRLLGPRLTETQQKRPEPTSIEAFSLSQSRIAAG